MDFIVSDLMMFVMDGMELFCWVKFNFVILYIFFLMFIVKIFNELCIESFCIGVDEYLLKLFDDILLLVWIFNILENCKCF